MGVYFSRSKLAQVIELGMVEFGGRLVSAMAGSALWQDRPRPSYSRHRANIFGIPVTFPLRRHFLRDFAPGRPGTSVRSP